MIWATLTGIPLGLLAAAGGEGGEFDAGEVILHHVSNGAAWIEDAWWSPSKAVLVMVVAAVLVILGVRRALAGYDENGVPRTRWAQVMDPFVEHFYRDIALAYAGPKWAKRVAPLLLTFFFFILANNLLGMVPWADLGNLVRGAVVSGEAGPGSFKRFVLDGAGTPTGNFNVTAALATISFFAIIYFGVRAHGLIGHFSQLAPKGVAWPVRWFLLLPIETMSMFVKPFALTMRLAANMTAGHMAILAILAIIFLLNSVLIGIPAVGLALGISLLEIIVCFVQAYVFALLSGVFIGMAIESHH
jgi:F-type H+-transporting ATPase subunit a